MPGRDGQLADLFQYSPTYNVSCSLPAAIYFIYSLKLVFCGLFPGNECDGEDREGTGQNDPKSLSKI